jgi:hypothetical protein
MAEVTLTGKVATTRQGILTPPIWGTATLTLSGYSFAAYSGAVVEETLENSYSLFSYGNTNVGTPNGVDATLSGYSFEALCGGAAALEVSLPTFAATGTPEQIGEAELRLSGYTFSAAATVSAGGGVVRTYTGQYSLSSFGGAQARGTLPRATVAVSGTASGRGQVDTSLPRLTLVASGYGDNLGQVVGVLPTLAPTPNGRVIAVLPRAMFVATGGSQSVVYEAYSITLNSGKEGLEAYTTHYTQYPFDRIVRFGGKYYGVAADGLFELNGDTYDEAACVDVHVWPRWG